MKINLKNSFLLLLSFIFIGSVHGGGCISKNKQKVYFKDSFLGTLSKEIANYILFLAEYQQMLDTRFVKYCNDYSCKKSYTEDGQYIARCKLPVGNFPSHNDVYFYPLSISNDKSKILFGYLSLDTSASSIMSVSRLYSCNPEIMKGRHFWETSAQLQEKFVPKLELLWENQDIIFWKGSALSNDGGQIFYLDGKKIKVLKSAYSTKYSKVIDLPSEIEPSEVRSIGYLDTFKQLCLITKAKHKPEKTTFIDLNQFGSCPVDKSKNLLHRFVLTEEVKRLHEDQFKK